MIPRFFVVLTAVVAVGFAAEFADGFLVLGGMIFVDGLPVVLLKTVLMVQHHSG